MGNGVGERDSGFCEFSERSGDLGKITDEATVEADETKEGASGGDVMGQRPVSDSGDFLGIYAEAFGGDDVAEEAGRVLGEGALGKLDFEIGGGQGSKDLVKQSQMLGLSLRVEEDVI